MRKYWLILPLLLVLALSACQPATQAATPTGAVIPTYTEAVAAPAAETPEVTEATVQQEATCRPYRLIDLVLPAATGNVPDATESDWIHGPSDAVVTIIEYSDYQ